MHVSDVMWMSLNAFDPNMPLVVLYRCLRISTDPNPAGLALVESQRLLYISGNHQIHSLDLDSGTLSSPAPEAMFQSPAGLAYNDLHNFLYVSDSGTHAVYSLNMTAESPMPVVVAGRPGFPGGPGDGSTFISRSSEGFLNRPDGLALDVIGQRLFIGDSTKAIRIVDLIAENMTLAAVRSSFQHESGHLGPIGLALGNTTIPGFKVESIWHNPLIGGPPTFGNYFYFQSSKGYASSHLSCLNDPQWSWKIRSCTSTTFENLCEWIFFHHFGILYFGNASQIISHPFWILLIPFFQFVPFSWESVRSQDCHWRFAEPPLSQWRASVGAGTWRFKAGSFLDTDLQSILDASTVWFVDIVFIQLQQHISLQFWCSFDVSISIILTYLYLFHCLTVEHGQNGLVVL